MIKARLTGQDDPEADLFAFDELCSRCHKIGIKWNQSTAPIVIPAKARIH